MIFTHNMILVDKSIQDMSNSGEKYIVTKKEFLDNIWILRMKNEVREKGKIFN